jgi:hypothetical protein
VSVSSPVTASDHPDADRTRSADAMVAVFVGPVAWAQQGVVLPPVGRATLALGVLGLVGFEATALGIVLSSEAIDKGSRVDYLVLPAAAVFTLAFPAIAAMWGRTFPIPSSLIAVLRAVALGALAIVFGHLSQPIEFGLFWPLWIYLGIETALTSWVLSTDGLNGVRSLRVVVSPLHLGLLSGVFAAVLMGDRLSAMRDVFNTVLLLETWIFGALLVHVVIGRMLKALTSEEREMIRGAALAASRSRAHWLHDDVCADVRALRLRLASKSLTIDEIGGELDELDFRLRSRQLDELIAGGQVDASEVIQPYVRRAQAHGLEIREMPRFEQASVSLDTGAAELLRAAAGGLIANAINATATWIKIRLSTTGNDLTLTVIDNAGGFDLAHVPSGRGLDQLAKRLGTGNLQVHVTTEGSEVVAHIKLFKPEAP